MLPRKPTPCQYSVELEPPETVIITVSGDVEAEHVEAIVEETSRLVGELPYFVELVDIRGLRSVLPEARKSADRAAGRVANRCGVAFVGGSRVMRVVVGFMSRTFAFFTGKMGRDPIRFFDTEAEARAWLAERQAVLQKEMAHPRQGH